MLLALGDKKIEEACEMTQHPQKSVNISTDIGPVKPWFVVSHTAYRNVNKVVPFRCPKFHTLHRKCKQRR
jgi:hypothetical protein